MSTGLVHRLPEQRYRIWQYVPKETPRLVNVEGESDYLQDTGPQGFSSFPEEVSRIPEPEPIILHAPPKDAENNWHQPKSHIPVSYDFAEDLLDSGMPVAITLERLVGSSEEGIEEFLFGTNSYESNGVREGLLDFPQGAILKSNLADGSSHADMYQVLEDFFNEAFKPLQDGPEATAAYYAWRVAALLGGVALSPVYVVSALGALWTLRLTREDNIMRFRKLGAYAEDNLPPIEAAQAALAIHTMKHTLPMEAGAKEPLNPDDVRNFYVDLLSEGLL